MFYVSFGGSRDFILTPCACVPLPNPNLIFLGTARHLHALYLLYIQRLVITNSNETEIKIRIVPWLIPQRGSRLEISRLDLYLVLAEDVFSLLDCPLLGLRSRSSKRSGGGPCNKLFCFQFEL